MVSKRRYNSVERFTSIHLSEFEQRQHLRPVEHSPIDASEAPSRTDLPQPSSEMRSPLSQQQQMAPHPFSPMRSRRSHEQLQISNPSPERPPDISPQSMLLQRQLGRIPPTQNSGGAPSLVSTSPSFSPQQQYSQRLGYPLPHTEEIAFSPQQLGRSPPKNPFDSQPVPALSASPHFQPVKMRFQQSPRDIRSIQNFSTNQEKEGIAQQQANSLSTSRIPTAVWATFSVLEVIAGVISLFVGALNASPYNCMIEPNIPIYLILSGLFLIFNGAARIFFALSAPSTRSSRRSRSQIGPQRKSTNRPILTYAIEGIGLIAILVVVILGSVWVFGASRYMHTQLYMFERHFCEHGLYWFAWWSVIIHLAMFVLLILFGIIVLIYGTMPGRR